MTFTDAKEGGRGVPNINNTLLSHFNGRVKYWPQTNFVYIIIFNLYSNHYSKYFEKILATNNVFLRLIQSELSDVNRKLFI